MADSTATAEDAVFFTEPLGQTLMTVFKMVCIMLLTLMIMTGIWAGAGTTIWPRDIPWWWHAVWGVAAVGAMIGLVAAFAGDIRRRLTLTEHDLWIGGLAYGQRIEYERVRFVRLEQPEKTVGKVQKLIIEPRRCKPASLWLASDAARECYQTLRDFCPRAATIDLDGEVEMPQNAEDARSVHFALSQSLRRKAWKQVASCVFMLCVWLFVVWAFVASTRSNGSKHPNSYVLLIALPTAMVGAGVSAVKNFRKSREHAAAMSLVPDQA